MSARRLWFIGRIFAREVEPAPAKVCQWCRTVIMSGPGPVQWTNCPDCEREVNRKIEEVIRCAD